MWMWSLPFFDAPWCTATHREDFAPSGSTKPISSTNRRAILPHFCALTALSSSRRDSEQCHT